MKKEKEHERNPLVSSFTEKPSVRKILRCQTFLRKKPAAATLQSEDSGGTSNPPTQNNSGQPIQASQNSSGQPIPASQNNSGQPIQAAGSTQSIPQHQVRPRSRNKGWDWNIDESHPRFGPVYRTELLPTQNFRERAWMHLVKKSMEKAARVPPNTSQEAKTMTMKEMETKILDTYSTAIRKVEAPAKTAYVEQTPIMIESEFRWMLIKDGCFFLQLALLILGYHKKLDYPQTDLYFGESHSERMKKIWIEAMFCAGNQIPLVVLRELMAQEFFKDIVSAEPRHNVSPQSLCDKVLHEFFILPILGGKGWLLQNKVYQEAEDILHGLRLQLLGSSEYTRDTDFDVEANKDALNSYDDDDDDDDDDVNFEIDDGTGAASSDNRERFMNFLNSLGLTRANEGGKRTFPCATDLKRGGIKIKILDNNPQNIRCCFMRCCFMWCRCKSSGIRGIHFKSIYFWAYLYMPTLYVDHNTEHILGNLMIDEKQRLRVQQPEVSSYLRFMSDIVRTRRDAILLLESGIIKGDRRDVEKLPGILNSLASEDIGLTHQLRKVRREVRDYSSPWVHYKSVINVVVFLTVLQAVFAVLAYFRPPKQ